MRGYKAANGNYITGKEIKQRNKIFKKRQKEWRRQQEQEQKRNDMILLAEIRQRRRESEQMIKNKEVFVIEAKKFLYYIGKNYNYKMFLIAYDICNYDYMQLKSDCKKGKINMEMIKEIYNIACNMFTKLDFYIEYI